MGGRRPRVLEPHRAFIVERLEAVPHLTLHQLKAELAERGVVVSHGNRPVTEPVAVADQNTRRCSRRPSGGRPGERRASRTDLAERRFFFVIATSCIRLLR